MAFIRLRCYSVAHPFGRATNAVALLMWRMIIFENRVPIFEVLRSITGSPSGGEEIIRVEIA
ncbi:hypothetical protein X734_27950 [Mesorhizobium sp. L2C084A000]|nr:hypothetical protein X734_27950 [Mesorhizobium sp. L2C084A000]